MLWKACRVTGIWLCWRVSPGPRDVWAKRSWLCGTRQVSWLQPMSSRGHYETGPPEPHMCLSQESGTHPWVMLLSLSQDAQVGSICVSPVCCKGFYPSNTPLKSRYLQSKETNFKRAWIFVLDGVWKLSCYFFGSLLVSCKASGTSVDGGFRLEWAQGRVREQAFCIWLAHLLTYSCGHCQSSSISSSSPI